MRKLQKTTTGTYNKWRKRYKCHKNKGDHTLVLIYARMGWWSDYIWEDWECTACGKQVLKYIKK